MLDSETRIPECSSPRPPAMPSAPSAALPRRRLASLAKDLPPNSTSRPLPREDPAGAGPGRTSSNRCAVRRGVPLHAAFPTASPSARSWRPWRPNAMDGCIMGFPTCGGDHPLPPARCLGRREDPGELLHDRGHHPRPPAHGPPEREGDGGSRISRATPAGGRIEGMGHELRPPGPAASRGAAAPLGGPARPPCRSCGPSGTTRPPIARQHGRALGPPRPRPAAGAGHPLRRKRSRRVHGLTGDGGPHHDRRGPACRGRCHRPGRTAGGGGRPRPGPQVDPSPAIMSARKERAGPRRGPAAGRRDAPQRRTGGAPAQEGAPPPPRPHPGGRGLHRR